MKKPTHIIAGLVILILVAVAAFSVYGDQGSAQPATPESTPNVVALNNSPQDTGISQPLPTGTVLPDQTVQADQSCIDCHNNADILKLLAEEEVVPEVPSEGSG